MCRSSFSLLWIIVLGGLTACGQGISKKVRSQVNYHDSFSQLQEIPDRYRGEVAMLGGKIIETHPLEKGAELVVLQLDLDRSDRPQDNDQSKGRFLVQSDHFLDPAVYSPGTLITVVGRLKGSEQRNIGQMAYRYPVISVEEIKKWPTVTETYPHVQFGIGVGTTF
jgi:outer membrane lipoprotein